MSRVIESRYILKQVVEDLIKEDTSRDVNINSQPVGVGKGKKETKIEEHSSKSSQIKDEQNSQESSASMYKKSNESPLFLATMSNINEIVEACLMFDKMLKRKQNLERKFCSEKSTSLLTEDHIFIQGIDGSRNKQLHNILEPVSYRAKLLREFT